MKKIITSLLASLIVFPVISQESSMIRRDTIIIYNPETHEEQIRVVEYNPANRHVADCYFISCERGIISKLDNGGLMAKTNLHLTQKNLEISYYSESSCNAIVELVHADTELFLENTKIADHSFIALPLQI